MLDSLFLRQVQSELFLNLFVDVSMPDIGDIRIYHERDEIEDEVCALAEDREGREAERLETVVVGG